MGSPPPFPIVLVAPAFPKRNKRFLGLSGGEEKKQFWRVVAHCCEVLPDHLPRYVMGVGWPVDLVICSLLGADMFDCVYPTRTAR